MTIEDPGVVTTRPATMVLQDSSLRHLITQPK